MLNRLLLLLSFTFLLAAGCSDDATREGTVTMTVSIASPAGNTQILAGDSVDFQGTVTGGSSPYAFNWTFDGANPDFPDEDPGLTSFTNEGTYNIVFQVTDAGGQVLTDTMQVTVSTIIADITSPATDITIYEGESVNFTGTYLENTAVLPITHAWDFNGGAANSAVQNPGATSFNTIGTYTVSYTAADSGAATDTDTVIVTVDPALVSIDITPPTGDLALGSSLTFTVTATYSDASTGDVTAGSTITSGDLAKITMAGAQATANLAQPLDTITITAEYTLGTTTVQDTAAITTVDPGTRTKTEIINYWNTIKPVASSITYADNPVYTIDSSGYEGRLTQQLITDGVNMVNFYRWLAGLPDNVVEDPALSIRCQKGAHVLWTLNDISQAYGSPHDPPLPTGSSAAYEANVFGGLPDASNTGGYNACSRSNVFRGSGAGWTPEATVKGYMEDWGAANEPILGHRRWILYPRLSDVGFGTVANAGYWASNMYVIKTPWTAPWPTFDYVAYPSEGYYPKDLFVTTAEWSFSVDTNKYHLDDAYVSVIRDSDSYAFPGLVTDLKDLGGYGITPTLGFKLNEATVDETYHVTVNDIWDKVNTQYVSYSYWVNFFNLP